MIEFKSWLESRTIWMALVAAAPVLTSVLGFDMNATLADILTIVGTLGAIYFRIRATKKLS